MTETRLPPSSLAMRCGTRPAMGFSPQVIFKRMSVDALPLAAPLGSGWGSRWGSGWGSSLAFLRGVFEEKTQETTGNSQE